LCTVGAADAAQAVSPGSKTDTEPHCFLSQYSEQHIFLPISSAFATDYMVVLKIVVERLGKRQNSVPEETLFPNATEGVTANWF